MHFHFFFQLPYHDFGYQLLFHFKLSHQIMNYMYKRNGYILHNMCDFMSYILQYRGLKKELQYCIPNKKTEKTSLVISFLNIYLKSTSSQQQYLISSDHKEKYTIFHPLKGHSMEACHVSNPFLPTWMPPCGPMSFAPMAASSRIDRGYHNLSKKTISNRQIFWLTFAWNGS